MNAVAGLICGGSALLLMWVVYETLKNMIAKETETRLERLPYAILQLARRRLPAEHRETIHDEEWLPELLAIVRETDGLPITRLLRGVDFAIGLLFNASRVSEVLGRLRRKPTKTVMGRPAGVEITFALGEPTVGPTIPTTDSEWPPPTGTVLVDDNDWPPLRLDPAWMAEGPGYVRDRAIRHRTMRERLRDVPPAADQ